MRRREVSLLKKLKRRAKQIISKIATAKSLAVLLLVLMSLLTGCATSNPTAINSCPAWPEPNSKVADELEKNCTPQEKCPYIWEWISRLYVLRDQLMVCQNTEKG